MFIVSKYGLQGSFFYVIIALGFSSLSLGVRERLVLLGQAQTKGLFTLGEVWGLKRCIQGEAKQSRSSTTFTSS